MLRWGFWKEEEDTKGLDPRAFVDPNWDVRARQAMVERLQASICHTQYRGWSECRMCGIKNGSTDDTLDGTVVWPSGLSHYIEVHDVRPPQWFVNHVMSHDHDARIAVAARHARRDAEIREMILEAKKSSECLQSQCGIIEKQGCITLIQLPSRPPAVDAEGLLWCYIKDRPERGCGGAVIALEEALMKNPNSFDVMFPNGR